MRVVVTGGSGRLGANIATALRANGLSVMTSDRAQLALDDVDRLSGQLHDLGAFDALVNAAAWTAVDACEDDPVLANRINGEAPGVLAWHCQRMGARMIQVSTDYVFPGKAEGTYAVDDAPAPTCVYGSSKLLGEQSALTAHAAGVQVVRTAWLYGSPGRAFVESMPDRLLAGQALNLIIDNFGQPTWAHDLAQRIATMLDLPCVPGVYHGTNAGEASWMEVAQRIARAVGADPGLLHAVSAADLERPAQRPSRVILDHANWATLGLPPMRAWQDALDDFLLEAAA